MTNSAAVAREAGVSRSTVSQVLNGHTDRFSPHTVESVLAAAHKLDYRPSQAGRALRRGRADLVVTLIHEKAAGPQMWGFVANLADSLAAVGINHLLHLHTDNPAAAESVIALKPLACISTGALPAAEARLFAAAGVPVIEAAATRVKLDVAIGRIQADHLWEVGYRALAVVRPRHPAEFVGTEEREAGAIRRARELGMLVLPTTEVDLEDPVFGLPATGPDNEPVGLACYNDTIALAALGQAVRSQAHVPANIGIIGADDTDLGRLTEPSITTVRINLAESTHRIVDIVRDDLESLQAALTKAPQPDLHVIARGTTLRRAPGPTLRPAIDDTARRR